MLLIISQFLWVWQGCAECLWLRVSHNPVILVSARAKATFKLGWGGPTSKLISIA